MTTDTPYISITFRSDLALLIVRWLREVSQTELQQGYADACQAAADHQAGRWLVDSRRRAEPDAQMVDWLAQEYLPALKPAVHNLPIHLACLVASTWRPTNSPVTPLATLAQVPADLERDYQIRLFGDEGAAMSWLKEQP